MRNPTASAGRTGDTTSLLDSSKKSSRSAPRGTAGWRLALILFALALNCPAPSLQALAPPVFCTDAARNPAVQQTSPDPPGPTQPASTGTARITYTRTLTGSVPEYLAVVVNSDGSGSYEGRLLKEAARARPLKLSGATTHQLFALAAALDDFRVPLESHKKVADLGLKTFTYEQGLEKHEVEFNYTTKQTARDLTDLFERIAGVEQHLETLQYALKYDPLSLPQELLHIQIDLEHKALADPELMVPELQEIANNPRLLHIAQVRAQDILKTVNGAQ